MTVSPTVCLSTSDAQFVGLLGGQSQGVGQGIIEGLNAAIRRKTAVDRYNHSRDEASRIAGQPDGSSD
jgi:hypothetical protein